MSWLNRVKKRKLEIEDATVKNESAKNVEITQEEVDEAKLSSILDEANKSARRGPLRLEITELNLFYPPFNGRICSAYELSNSRMAFTESTKNGRFATVKYRNRAGRGDASTMIAENKSGYRIIASCAYAEENKKDTSLIMMSGKKFIVVDTNTGTQSQLQTFVGIERERALEIHKMVSPDLSFPDKNQNSSRVAALCSSGTIYIIDGIAKACEVILRLNSDVTCGAFHPILPYFIAGDDKGTIYAWDLISGKCLSKIKTTLVKLSSIAVSGTSYVAVGSPSGFVHLFRLDSNGVFQSNDPLKELKSIRFETDLLSFHPYSHYLVIGSTYANNQIKILRLKDMSVVANFPQQSGARGTKQFNLINNIQWGVGSGETGESNLIISEVNGRTLVYSLGDAIIE